MLERACSGASPMASRTWDGSTEPDEQAAPVETAKPRRSSAMTRDSAETPSKRMLVVLGRRGEWPALT